MTALSKSAELFVLVSKSDPKQFFSGQAKKNEWKTGNTLIWPSLIQDGIPTDHAMIELSDEAHKFVAQSFMKKGSELIPLTSGLTTQGDSAIDTFTDTIRAFKPELDDMFSEDDFENLYAEQQFDAPDLMVHTDKANTLFVPLYTAEGTMDFFYDYPELADEFKAIRFSEFISYNRELVDGVYFGRVAQLLKPASANIEAIRAILNNPDLETEQKKRAFHAYLKQENLIVAEKDFKPDMFFSSYEMNNTDVTRLRFESNYFDRGLDLEKEKGSIGVKGWLFAHHFKDHNTRAAYEAVATAITTTVHNTNWREPEGRAAACLALVSTIKYHLGDAKRDAKQPGSDKTYFDTFKTMYADICEKRADTLGQGSFYAKELYIKPERNEMNERAGRMTVYMAGVTEPVVTLHNEEEITKAWSGHEDYIKLEYPRVIIDGVYPSDDRLIEGTTPGFARLNDLQVTFSVIPDDCTTDVFAHLDKENQDTVREQVEKFVAANHQRLAATMTLESTFKQILSNGATPEDITNSLISTMVDATNDIYLTGSTSKMTSLAMQAMSLINDREMPGLTEKISDIAQVKMKATTAQPDFNPGFKI